MSEHSILAPSSAARRIACPGSQRLEAQYPQDKESSHAREGEAAHWVASELLKNNDWVIPAIAPNGEPISQAMIDGAEMYVDHIRGFFASGMKLSIEEKIHNPSIHENSWGTPDAWLFNRLSREVHVWDYKFGFGFVEVFENWQLIAYTSGILDLLGVDGIADQYLQVYMHIVQPRSYHRDGHIRTWSSLAANLRGYFNRLRDAENTSLAVNAQCRPSPECNYCKARHACPALQQASLRSIDGTANSTPFDLNPTQTGNELRYLKNAADLLESRISGLSEQALAMLQRGDRVPGFKAEQPLGRQVWNKPASEIITMGELMDIQLAKTPQVITPKQAIAAGLPIEMINDYAITPHGAFKLVEDLEIEGRKMFGGKK